MQINLKSPGSHTDVGYHQDFAYTPHSDDDVVTALLILDDMTLENGCLQVVPGSHRGPEGQPQRGPDRARPEEPQGAAHGRPGRAAEQLKMASFFAVQGQKIRGRGLSASGVAAGPVVALLDQVDRLQHLARRRGFSIGRYLLAHQVPARALMSCHTGRKS